MASFQRRRRRRKQGNEREPIISFKLRELFRLNFANDVESDGTGFLEEHDCSVSMAQYPLACVGISILGRTAQT
jgi:hypothetical protein